MSDWLPIETAPKGDDRIIVAGKKLLDPSVWVGEVYWDQAGWMIANCGSEYGQYIEATHWMKLPEPPK